MVKAPEKFMEKYLSHEKALSSKKGSKPSHAHAPISAGKMKRVKKNMQIIWGIYATPEIKEIISKKEKIRFLDVRSARACLSLYYVDKGVLAEYEEDIGTQKDLAGARLYKQSETLMSRYFYTEKGAEELLKSKNTAYQAFVDILSKNDIEEKDIWDAIAGGERIKLSSIF
ncbi:MAG: hypothetical protein E3K37_04260 [Candidatus Kuenenia sp.]|nr:hypothetical protein [Candidatus Kuenenia hertensis]